MTVLLYTTIFYDGQCRFCRRLAWLGERVLPDGRYRFAPLQSALPAEAASRDAWLTEMHAVTPRGATFGGADALLEIARGVWWLRPLTWSARLPGGRALLRRGYRWIAAHRSCDGGACRLPETRPFPAAASALLTAFFIVRLIVRWSRRPRLPAWIFMWLLAGAIYFLAKLLTLRGQRAPLRARLAYLLLWVGMDAPAFLHSAPPPRPAGREWAAASAKTALGAALLWGAARKVRPPALQAWTGLAGIIFLLHFGTFHLLSLGWRRLGRDARPIMRHPLAARSVGEFWGRRWNRGFNDLVRTTLFRPLHRRVGTRAATLGVFLASGLVHELVISLPARGGFGLPTAYFGLQGAAVAFERSAPGRRLGLGRLFVLAVTAAPAFWLFHPRFIRRVALPMLKTLRAL